MASHDPVDEVDPGDPVVAGDTVVVERLQVFCADFGEASLAALDGGPSVVIAFHGETLAEEERSVRVLVPARSWPLVNRLARDAIAVEEGRAAQEALGDADLAAWDVATEELLSGSAAATIRGGAPPVDGDEGDDGDQDVDDDNDADEDDGGDDDDDDDDDDTGPTDPADAWDLDDDEYDAHGDWIGLSCDLIEVIEVLEPGQFLILSGPDNRFVQLFVDEDDAQLETVSNQFLEPGHRLSFEVLDLLEEQGWSRPTHFSSAGPLPEGASPNHFMELGEGWQVEEVAARMISTLRDVHRVPSPVEVAYTAGSIDGETILLPLLGLPRLRE